MPVGGLGRMLPVCSMTQEWRVSARAAVLAQVLERPGLVVSCHRIPAEIVDSLETALEKFRLVAAKLGATASSDAVP